MVDAADLGLSCQKVGNFYIVCFICCELSKQLYAYIILVRKIEKKVSSIQNQS